MANSKVKALEAEALGLWRDLISAMDANNASKEQLKVLSEKLDSEKQLVKQKDELLTSAGQRMNAVIAKAVLAFQSTNEYNTILFQWYFKGFELWRKYLIKHGSGTDLDELDFEAIDKEMEEDEVALATQTAASAGADPSQVDKDEENTPPA